MLLSTFLQTALLNEWFKLSKRQCRLEQLKQLQCLKTFLTACFHIVSYQLFLGSNLQTRLYLLRPDTYKQVTGQHVRIAMTTKIFNTFVIFH